MTDTRKDGWFGRLDISTEQGGISEEGSILGIVAKLIGIIQRTKLSGQAGRVITITLSDKPIRTVTLTTESQLVSLTHDGPREGETYEQFYLRLIGDGCTESIAKYMADDWFECDPDSALLAWMNDSKAQRFMQLQASKAEYESALPSEYESLKQYVISTYPERAKQFTFRTA